VEDQNLAVVVQGPAPLVAPSLGEDDARQLRDAWLAGRNSNTRRAYAQTAADFASYLGRRTQRPFDEVEALRELCAAGAGAANLLALEYRTDLLARKLAPGTVGLRLSNLRMVVRLGRMLGLVDWTIEVPRSKGGVAYRDTRGPGRGAVRSMLDALGGRHDAKGRRDFAVLRLLYDLGLRRFEVAGLDLEHLELEAARLSVLRKGKVERLWLSVPGPTVRALEAWLAVRGTAPGPLFTGFRGGKGQRLACGGVYRAVRAMGRDVGETVRPHGIRHTSITEAVKRSQAAGIGLDQVRDFSGHADVQTLMIYRDREEDMQGRIAALVAEDP
jgi:integrase/recombinase XerC